MGQIKSALELALERTKDVEVDREGLEAKEYREKGMRLVAKIEQDPAFDLNAELKTFKDKQLAWVKEGMKSVLGGFLNLPNTVEQTNRIGRIAAVFMALAHKPKEMEGYIEELVHFFQQFLQQRDQLVAAVRQQLEPSVKQKEDAIYQQTGRRTRISIETDPEFSKFLTMNLDKLQSQYETALVKVKEEILSLMK